MLARQTRNVKQISLQHQPASYKSNGSPMQISKTRSQQQNNPKINVQAPKLQMNNLFANQQQQPGSQQHQMSL